MKIKVKSCDSDFLEEFKRNFDEKYAELYWNKDRKGIEEVFNNELVYNAPSNYDFEYHPIELNLPASEFYVTNIKNVYGPLRHLSPAEASHEELWFTMINTVYLDFLMDTLELIKRDDKEKYLEEVKRNLFFIRSRKRSLAIHRLARLWWMGYNTYDEQNTQDPYELSDFFYSQDAAGKGIVIFTNIFSNKDTALGVIEAVRENQHRVSNRKETYNEINKYLNGLSGVQVIDILSRERIKQLALDRIDLFFENPEIVIERDRNKVFL